MGQAAALTSATLAGAAACARGSGIAQIAECLLVTSWTPWLKFGRRSASERAALARQKQFTLTPCDRSAAPRYDLVIAAIVRNEAPYLREWIEFHALVGVGHFYIYDNDSSDGSADILEHYRRQGLATVLPWPPIGGWNGQTAAYAHATAAYRRAARWMACIDVDEFLFPETAATLTEALTGYGSFARLSIPWRCFGHGGHDRRPEGLTIENYLRCSRLTAPELTKTKSIVDPCRVSELHVHAPVVAGEATTLHGGILLNHYVTRSCEEFEAKVARGYVYKDNGQTAERARKSLALRDLIESDTVADDRITRFAPALRDRLA
jgi:hypothetical protein